MVRTFQDYHKYTPNYSSEDKTHLCIIKIIKSVLFANVVRIWDSTQSKWTVESGIVQILVNGSFADSTLKITKDITVCSSVVDVAYDKRTKVFFPHRRKASDF